ncbi:MAG: RNA methyltransferase [Chloroflexi bacterium]|nr:MAG: RNA methyltransferase [Chloroflexota bacterium]
MQHREAGGNAACFSMLHRKSMTLITSPSNPRIGKVQDLHTPKGRKKQGLFLMEGPHLLDVLLDNAVLPLEIYYSPALLARTAHGRALLHRLLHTTSFPRDRLIEVSERVIESLGETQTSQGVVSVLPLSAFKPEQTRARRPASHLPTPRPALLILDGLADPGNMGTILRTALAADVEEVLLTPNCVDCFSPKVVRAAAGAHVALPLAVNQSWAAIAARIQAHCQGDQHVLLAEAGSSRWYYEQDLHSPFALIIGNEAHGPSPEARNIATASIAIPLANNVESLNAAMATGIILYEALRQSRSHS